MSLFHGQSRRPRKYSEEDFDLMVKMRRDGRSYAEIGEHFGVGSSAIEKRFNEDICGDCRAYRPRVLKEPHGLDFSGDNLVVSD